MSTIPPHVKKLQQQFAHQPKQVTAQQLVAEYFSYISPAQVQEQLWELTHGCITNELLHDTQTGMQRHNQLYFYEHTKIFIEAVHFLYSRAAATGAPV